MIAPRELRDRGVVAPRDRRERLARADDVNPAPRAMRVAVMGGAGGDDLDAVRERNRVPAGERRQRVRADDAVAAQVEALLHEAHAVQRRPVVVRIDRDADPLADEQELEDGDVPAERAAVQRARTEERATERAHRRASARVRETGDREPLHPLEGARGGDRLRPRESVDRAAVEALGAQRDLQAGRLRVPAARGERRRRRGHGDRKSCSDEDEAQAHGVHDYAPCAASPPAVSTSLPTDEARRALLGEGGEALLRVLAREQVAELLGLALERARREVEQPLRDAQRDRALRRELPATSSAWSRTGSAIALTRPIRSASSASTRRPVRISSFATPRPQTRASRCVPPQPGTMPRSISGWPSRALLEA